MKILDNIKYIFDILKNKISSKNNFRNRRLNTSFDNSDFREDQFSKKLLLTVIFIFLFFLFLFSYWYFTGNLIEKEDVELIEDILIQKHEQIYEQMRALKERRAAVSRAIMSIERYRKAPTKGTLVLEFIDRRYIWGLPCIGNFYEGDIKSYEAELYRFRNALTENGFNHIHTFNIGTSIDKNDFIQGNFKAKNIFIFTNHHDKADSTTLNIIDSGMFACIYLDNYDDELEYAKRLKEFCEENHYQIVGDYICEVLTEFNVFDSDQRSMFMKLQVPVKFQ